MGKKRRIFKFAFMMAIVLFSICLAVIQGMPTSALASEVTNRMAVDVIANVFGRDVQTLDYLYNFDESADFVYAEFEGGGYAVLYYFIKTPLNHWNALWKGA